MIAVSPELLAAGLLLLLVLVVAVLVVVLSGRGRAQAEVTALREGMTLLQRGLETAQRAEAEAVRAALADAERALGARAEASRAEMQGALGGLATQVVRDAGEQRVLLETTLREMGAQTTARLGESLEKQLAGLTGMERALVARAETTRAEGQELLGVLSQGLLRSQGEQAILLETKLREMGEQSAVRLGEIQRSVNERLTETIEKQMAGSFQRVIDQFGAVQKAMGDVQAVTSQIGDLKRIFTNVKTRGAWGEMHLRALLEDVLPQGAWEANRRLRIDSDDVVEFVLLMPSRSTPRPVLAVDAKFPAEDYDRLVLASEAGDLDGERLARRGLEARLRLEAKKIGGKYVVPPATVEFAVMYLPTDGLYLEAARMPGLIESLNRDHRVLVMGPTLLPALLRTIQLGALTLQIEQRSEDIGRLLGAVKNEFLKMDEVLQKLEKQAGNVSNTIGDARTRTRLMGKKLKDVTLLADAETREILSLEAALEAGDPAAEP